MTTGKMLSALHASSRLKVLPHPTQKGHHQALHHAATRCEPSVVEIQAARYATQQSLASCETRTDERASALRERSPKRQSQGSGAL